MAVFDNNRPIHTPSTRPTIAHRLIKYGFGISLVLISFATPLFSLTLGGVLSLVGDLYGADNSPANAYVILGGGLTDEATHNQSLIVLNAYSDKRTQTLKQAWKKNPLPIIISGVEAPWIADSLKDLKNSQAVIISDNASMNTCENIRFSAKLMAYEQRQGNLPAIRHVYLVSDWYHMARARRQFAKVGIATTPLVAPLPSQRAWGNPKGNLSHSRRAFYEWVALVRDIVRPQRNCRHSDDVSISTIKSPRASAGIFS